MKVYKTIDCESSVLDKVINDYVREGWELFSLIFTSEHISENYTYKMFKIVFVRGRNE